MFSVPLPRYDLHYNIILSCRSSPRHKLMTAPLAASRILGFTTIPISYYIVITHRLCLGRWMSERQKTTTHRAVSMYSSIYFFILELVNRCKTKRKKYILYDCISQPCIPLFLSLSLSYLSSRSRPPLCFTVSKIRNHRGNPLEGEEKVCTYSEHCGDPWRLHNGIPTRTNNNIFLLCGAFIFFFSTRVLYRRQNLDVESLHTHIIIYTRIHTHTHHTYPDAQKHARPFSSYRLLYFFSHSPPRFPTPKLSRRPNVPQVTDVMRYTRR